MLPTGEKMTSKDDLIRKYKEYKHKHQAIPKFKDFCKFAGIPKRQLASLYGRDAYAKFQQACGDDANKFRLERTPRDVIMRQYGDLAVKLEELPNSSNWRQNACKPSVEGLVNKPHSIKWSDFPQKFFEWVKTENIHGYEKVLDFINKSPAKPSLKIEGQDREFEAIIAAIRAWSPGRRRNSEGEYRSSSF